MKRNEIIVYEHKKGVRAVKYNQKPQTTIEPPKPRNPVAKNAGAAIGGGAAGAHKDAKKASQAVRGQKHKNAEMAEASKPRNPTRDHLRRYPVPQDQVARPVKKEKKSVAEDNTRQKIVDLARGLLDKYHGSMEPEDAYQKVADELDIDIESLYDLLGDDSLLGVEEMYGRKNSYYNPMDYERDQQRQMDYDKREFKRQELQHELGHEDDPNFERNFRQQQMDRDRGPWYIKINGKILKVKGEPKVFDWKNGATKYGQAILKNKPELTGKIMLTKNGVDDVAEAGAEVGTISKVDPMTKKATVTKSDGSSMEVDSAALKPTPDGKMQMDVPDADEMKSGTKVVSTEMVNRLRKLAGL